MFSTDPEMLRALSRLWDPRLPDDARARAWRYLCRCAEGRGYVAK